MYYFTDIKQLLQLLGKEQKLIQELFTQRKKAYRFELAIEVVDNNPKRIDDLVDRGVAQKNGNQLELDDHFLQFFEQVLEINEDINTSYINENLQLVKENIDYFLSETNTKRNYQYLRKIEKTLRMLGQATLRNVIDLSRNVETTFKNEPNYKIKKAKLENLDEKRKNIEAFPSERAYLDFAESLAEFVEEKK